ncbi:spondin-1-like [Stylophora pistillata]|nr:spondin-1-like [Stylophora pistillata]
MLVVLITLISNSDAWWSRRRRRRCQVDCRVNSWSSWSQCTADKCGERGSETRTRRVETSPKCGGKECPELRETRQCYSSKEVNCELSSWSKWSACTTKCGVSGIQTSIRHRTVVEQCGGNCSSILSKTRSCPEISCLNGGSVNDKTCICKDGYEGECCENQVVLPHCVGIPPTDCQLTSWSQWGACSATCGETGTQVSHRYRTTTEKCGGTCSGGSNLTITRACFQITCLNGGSLKKGQFFCKEGYTGVCCEEGDAFPPPNGEKAGVVLLPTAFFVFGIIVIIIKVIKKSNQPINRVAVTGNNAGTVVNVVKTG